MIWIYNYLINRNSKYNGKVFNESVRIGQTHLSHHLQNKGLNNEEIKGSFYDLGLEDYQELRQTGNLASTKRSKARWRCGLTHYKPGGPWIQRLPPVSWSGY